MKLTKAQRRYLQAIDDGVDVLRPAGLGGKFGDVRVIARLRNAGYLIDANVWFVITDAGRAALKGGAK